MNFVNVWKALEIMGKGMAAIFIVLLAIYICVILILRIKPKQDSER